MSTSLFKSLNIAVLTISDTRGEDEDTSGKLLVESLRQAGHQNIEKTIVRDDKYAIRHALSRWIADPEVDAVLTTGGTGITGRDGTPEAVPPLLDKEIEGFGEMFRVLSYDEIKPRRCNHVLWQAWPMLRLCSFCQAPAEPADWAGTS